MFSWRFTRKQFDVCVDHDADELVKSHLGFPAKNFFGLGWVTDQKIYFRRTLIAWIVFNKFLPVEIDMRKGRLNKLTHSVRFASGEHKIVPLSMLKDSPHPFHVLTRISPISLCIKGPQEQFFLQSMLDGGDCARDFARDKGFTAARTLVIEQDAIARTKPVALAIVYRCPIREGLGHTIRAA